MSELDDCFGCLRWCRDDGWRVVERDVTDPQRPKDEFDVASRHKPLWLAVVVEATWCIVERLFIDGRSTWDKTVIPVDCRPTDHRTGLWNTERHYFKSSVCRLIPTQAHSAVSRMTFDCEAYLPMFFRRWLVPRGGNAVSMRLNEFTHNVSVLCWLHASRDCWSATLSGPRCASQKCTPFSVASSTVAVLFSFVCFVGRTFALQTSAKTYKNKNVSRWTFIIKSPLSLLRYARHDKKRRPTA